MDMFDEARAIRSTMELCHLTQSELARQLGVSQSYVANKLRLLGLSDAVIDKIRALGVSERHARAILRLGDEDQQLKMLDEVSDRGMTVRECEGKIDALTLAKIPESFSRYDGLERLENFRAAIGKGVELLTAAGINARVGTRYADGNMYITVVVKDV